MGQGRTVAPTRDHDGAREPSGRGRGATDRTPPESSHVCYGNNSVPPSTLPLPLAVEREAADAPSSPTPPRLLRLPVSTPTSTRHEENNNNKRSRRQTQTPTHPTPPTHTAHKWGTRERSACASHHGATATSKKAGQPPRPYRHSHHLGLAAADRRTMPRCEHRPHRPGPPHPLNPRSPLTVAPEAPLRHPIILAHFLLIASARYAASVPYTASHQVNVDA